MLIYKKIGRYISSVQEYAALHSFVFPISLLVLTLATYGVFIFALGFYWDDWPPILLSHIVDKSAVWNYFFFDRPFQSWTYYLLFPVCGDSTFAWQLSAILFRWTAALALYFTFLRIFPRQKNLFQWATVLFVVFPGFADQYSAVSFGSHFIVYTVFGLSLLTMVLAIQNKNRFWIFFLISLALTAIHLFTMEYFVGLEIIRPVLIFILLKNRDDSKRIFIKTLKYFLPYFAILTFFLYWRMVLYPQALGGNHESNYPFLIADFLKNPGTTLFTFLQIIESDLRFLFLTSWTDRLWPIEWPVQRITYWLSLFVGMIITGLYFIVQKSKETFLIEIKEAWKNIGIGFLIIFFGMFPVWSTLRQITLGKWSDRFGLAAIFGVTLILSTLLYAFFQNSKVRNTLFILLTLLSISFQIQNGNDYRKDFIRQQDFYTQLKWRIPGLEPGTALYSPTIPTGKESEYSYSAGINLLYGNSPDPVLDYWMTGPRYFSPDTLVDDRSIEIKQGLRIFQFKGSASKIVSIHMPETGCLWVVDSNYSTINSLVPIEEFWLYDDFSRQDLIVDEINPVNGLSAIFDFNSHSNWCFYFEKGDLAQSKGRYEEAISYYEQAMENKLVPLESIEYMPFIKAYVGENRIEDALSLTRKSFAKPSYAKPVLCQYWKDYLEQNSNVTNASIEEVYNSNNCSSVLH
jgi:hypothetical protein